MKHLSVILPVHNEEKNISNLYQELKEELKGLDYELVFVDDGSRDNSFSVLEQLAKKDKQIRIVKLLSNYGQSTALAAGVEHAQGKNIVTMDSDGQHDPKDIRRLIQPLDRVDVVCGWRLKRGGPAKAIPSKIANYLVNRMTGLKLNDSVGGMKAFRKEVAEVVPIYGDMHRYLPVLAKWKGFRVVERPIKVRKRKTGKTHYKLSRIFGGFFDLMTVKFFISYSNRPIRFFAPLGLASFSLGIIIAAYYVMKKVIFGVHLMEEVAALILSVLLILLGVLVIFFGLIADMISYDAISSKKRKMYLVEKVV